MGKALYRKYRSTTLDEIVGQEHITSTFKNALKHDRISHAYLLTGPRGVGKTSIARILAHEINDLAYSDDPKLDIIEIDAASNRRIDEIRDLREKVSIAPTNAKYKVYIIDEVHMLTKEAFNALLKTLEEPPAHVIFILATTESHKLPATIISRTQRFTFLPVPAEKVVAHLRSIADKESIDITDEALQLVAEYGEGSFRDSISLLDQLGSKGGTLTAQEVLETLGRAPDAIINDLITAIEQHDMLAVSQKLTEMTNAGYDEGVITLQLAKKLREDVLNAKTGSQPQSWKLRLLKELLAIPGSTHAKQLLELALLSATIPEQAPVQNGPAAKQTTKHKSAPKPTPEPTPIAPLANVDESSPNSIGKKTTEEPAITEVITEAPLDGSGLKAADAVPARDYAAEELWQEVLQVIKPKYNTLYGIARMGKASMEGDTLHVSLKFAFHIKRIKEAKNMKLIIDTVTKLRGKPTKVELHQATDIETKKQSPDAAVSTISNIFGSAELL